MSEHQSTCDACGDPGRLHRHHGTEETTIPTLVCDDCFEQMTGLIAECEPFCALPLDHLGECRDRP